MSGSRQSVLCCPAGRTVSSPTRSGASCVLSAPWEKTLRCLQKTSTISRTRADPLGKMLKRQRPRGQHEKAISMNACRSNVSWKDESIKSPQEYGAPRRLDTTGPHAPSIEGSAGVICRSLRRKNGRWVKEHAGAPRPRDTRGTIRPTNCVHGGNKEKDGADLTSVTNSRHHQIGGNGTQGNRAVHHQPTCPMRCFFKSADH